MLVAQIDKQERDRRRRIADRAEYLADISEEFDEAKVNAIERGDRAEVRRLSQEFAPKRTAHRQEDERLGIRGRSPVMLSTNMWYVWTAIALTHEAAALAARDDLARWAESGEATDARGSLGRGLKSGLQTVTSCAFAIDALFGAVCYLTPQRSASSRWSLIRQTLDTLFDLEGMPKLQQRMERLFDVRDIGVHPWEALQVPIEHPDTPGMNVSYESSTFTGAEAAASVDLVIEVLERCTTRPRNRRAARSAKQNRNAVERLIKSRASDRPGENL